jgi:hypothetical protein
MVDIKMADIMDRAPDGFELMALEMSRLRCRNEELESTVSWLKRMYSSLAEFMGVNFLEEQDGPVPMTVSRRFTVSVDVNESLLAASGRGDVVNHVMDTILCQLCVAMRSADPDPKPCAIEQPILPPNRDDVRRWENLEGRP